MPIPHLLKCLKCIKVIEQLSADEANFLCWLNRIGSTRHSYNHDVVMPMDKFFSEATASKKGLVFYEEMYRFYIHHLVALGIIIYTEEGIGGSRSSKGIASTNVELEVTNFGFTFIRACLPEDPQGYWTGKIDQRVNEKGGDISGF